MAFAACEKERVNAYILPIFRSYGFVTPEGTPITDPDNLDMHGSFRPDLKARVRLDEEEAA